MRLRDLKNKLLKKDTRSRVKNGLQLFDIATVIEKASKGISKEQKQYLKLKGKVEGGKMLIQIPVVSIVSHIWSGEDFILSIMDEINDDYRELYLPQGNLDHLRENYEVIKEYAEKSLEVQEKELYLLLKRLENNENEKELKKEIKYTKRSIESHKDFLEFMDMVLRFIKKLEIEEKKIKNHKS